MSGDRVAVVTIAHGRHRHLLNQLASLQHGARRPDHHVVVAIDDRGISDRVLGHPLDPDVVHLDAEGSELPLAKARNRGVRRAVDEGAEVVVLLDVDCLAGHELVSGYAEAVRGARDVVWSGPVTYLSPPPPSGYDVRRLADLDDPHPARPAPPPGTLTEPADPDLFWSLSFALHADTWERIGGFCEEYVGYGAEDTDFARAALTRGARLGWAGSPRAYHQHHPTSEPPVQHLDSILRNAAVFHRRWQAWPMQGWLDEFERLGLAVRTSHGWERSTRTSGPDRTHPSGCDICAEP
jgi:N-acetylglucosaminyl-diphospho-decaprenol L-rhamnosyltransferase